MGENAIHKKKEAKKNINFSSAYNYGLMSAIDARLSTELSTPLEYITIFFPMKGVENENESEFYY